MDESTKLAEKLSLNRQLHCIIAAAWIAEIPLDQKQTTELMVIGIIHGIPRSLLNTVMTTTLHVTS
tara:strand:- start:164 stop:361 length:198 start_codon:yes stop_codon:yes gene_type:complete